MQTAMLRHDLPWLRANLDRSVLTNYDLSSVLVLDARNRIVYALGHPPAVADLPPATFQRDARGDDVRRRAVAGASRLSTDRGQHRPAAAGGDGRIRAPRSMPRLLGEIGASTNHSVALLGPSGTVVARGPGLPGGIPWGQVAAAGTAIRMEGAWGFGGRPLVAAGGRQGATLVVIESRAVTLRAEDRDAGPHADGTGRAAGFGHRGRHGAQPLAAAGALAPQAGDDGLDLRRRRRPATSARAGGFSGRCCRTFTRCSAVWKRRCVRTASW